MEISYSADVPELDQFAIEAEQERPERPLRLRVQPTLLRQSSGEAGNHRGWPGVSWTLECQDAAEAIGVRKALEAFFTAIAQHGPGAVEKALTPPGPLV
jgi:hypothetical protein